MTRVRVLDSEASREQKREAARERTATAQRRSAAELKVATDKLAARCSELAAYCGKDQLTRRLNELDAQRRAPQFWRSVDAANAALVEIDELKGVLTRLESLHSQVEAIAKEFGSVPSARQLEFIERSFDQAAQETDIAELELMQMGANGKADLLAAITPIGNSTSLRELLFDTYRGWAKSRGHQLQLLGDPLTETDPIFFALKGAYAYGYLQREHGVHRLRHADDHEAVRVTVAPWSHALTDVKFGHQRALKQPGKFGEKIRSHIEVVSDAQFVLQNSLTIAENRELAREIASSWQHSLSSDAVVRRYDLEPFLLKDHLTGITSGRRSSLRPIEFHELLCKRVASSGTIKEPFHLLR